MKHNVIDGSGFARISRTTAVALLAGLLAVGCGSKDEGAAAEGSADKSATTATAGKQGADAKGGAVATAAANDKTANMATAVADSKTTAPIDLKYDVLAKPDIGQPFEIELAFVPQVAADTLEVEVNDAPGLVIVGERAASFAPVASGEIYTHKILLRGDNVGLFYVSVLAKVSTKVQSESRAFSIPVVIGTVPAAQTTAPAVDAADQAIQSMPATEKKE
jgi:hypothetical protein